MQAAPPYLGGFGGSARTEHGPLIPQPSPEHRIHAKTPSSSPKPPCRPSARRALGTHCACAALRRHFGRCRSGPPRGRPPAEAAPGGVPQPLGVPRAPCPGTPRWGCGAARPAPLRLVAAGGACWSPSLAAGARWQAPVCGGEFIWWCVRQWCPNSACRVSLRFSVCQCWCLHVNPTPQLK